MGGKGCARSRIIRRQESLALYDSILSGKESHKGNFSVTEIFGVVFYEFICSLCLSGEADGRVGPVRVVELPAGGLKHQAHGTTFNSRHYFNQQ